jgi:hypothetical protein
MTKLPLLAAGRYVPLLFYWSQAKSVRENSFSRAQPAAGDAIAALKIRRNRGALWMSGKRDLPRAGGLLTMAPPFRKNSHLSGEPIGGSQVAAVHRGAACPSQHPAPARSGPAIRQ